MTVVEIACPGPAPEGSGIAFTLACSLTSMAVADADAQHEVVINHDWTVKTQHDMDAERIALAFGSETACWAFVARTVPAWRYTLGLLSGHIDVRDFRTHDMHYRSSQAVNCGAMHVHDSARDLVAHELSAGHLSRKFAIEPWDAITVLKLVGTLWLADSLPEWPFYPPQV